MTTTISLNKIKFRANHGFYEKERLEGNDFIIDVSVKIKVFDSKEDNINDTANYEDIFKICEEEMVKTKKLLESVVFEIITRLKNEFKNLSAGSVSLYKLNPPLKGDVDSAQVKMEF